MAERTPADQPPRAGRRTMTTSIAPPSFREPQRRTSSAEPIDEAPAIWPFSAKWWNAPRRACETNHAGRAHLILAEIRAPGTRRGRGRQGGRS
uniref:Uncharacterized protein n=1 Tax=Pseudomonas phage PACT201 TaxID=3230130 RepID=A0AAU8GV16_9VIRU